MDVFRGPGQRVPLEDVVTSTVFGPLLFIDQHEAATAVSLMLRTLGVAPPDWIGPVSLSLWPRRRTAEALRSSYVEPDAEIVDTAGASLLIEVKWGAPLGRAELAAQWLSLPEAVRAHSRHLLIVLEPGPYHASIRRDRERMREHCSHPWPLHVVSWRRMADAFRAIGRDMLLNPGTRRWAMGVHGFLRREDPRSLAGWSDLDLVGVGEVGWRFARRLVSRFADLPETAWRYEEGWFARLGGVEALTGRRVG